MAITGKNPGELPIVAFDTADYVLTRNPLAADTKNELSRTPISQFAASIHDHDDRYYTEAEIDALLSGYSVSGHTHALTEIEGVAGFPSTLLNDLVVLYESYAQKTEVILKSVGGTAFVPALDADPATKKYVDDTVAGSAPAAHTHDDRYYTEAEIDALLADFYTDVEVDALLAGKAAASHTHDDRYYTEAEVTALLVDKADKSNVIEKDNTSAFTPTADYHPATKKYVDDNAGGLGDAPVDGSEYVRKDAAWVVNTGGVSPELGHRTVYNAITDGGLNADYVNEQNPGTNDQALAKSWMEGGQATKRVFYFPAGKYRWDLGTVALSNAVSGYDDFEVYGDGIGQTILQVPGFQEITDDITLFKFAVLDKTSMRPKFHDIEFRIGWHCGEAWDDGTARVWMVQPRLWTADQDVDDGQGLESSDGNWFIKYHGEGYTGATEPTWAAGAGTENGVSYTAYPITTRVNNAVVTSDSFIRYSVGSRIIYVKTGGTLAASEPTAKWFSTGGAAEGHDIECVALGSGSTWGQVYNCKFKGLIGYSNAAGCGVKVASIVYNSEDRDPEFYRVGRSYHRVDNCIFEDFQCGTGIISNCNAVWITNSTWIRTGGWGANEGGFTAHSIYGQQGAVILNNCRFIEQYGGICVKVHPNVPERDAFGHSVTNCEFRDFEYVAISLTSSGLAPNVSHPDFGGINDYQTFPGRAISVVGNMFRQTKSRQQGALCALQDQWGFGGMTATGNTFLDVCAFYGNFAGTGGYMNMDTGESGIMFSDNYVSGNWRTPGIVWAGQGLLTGNTFDLRYADRSDASASIELMDNSIFKDNSVWFTGCGNNAGEPVIALAGEDIRIEGNFIGNEGANTDIVFSTDMASNRARIRNNHVQCGSAHFIRVNKTTPTDWLIEGNTISGTSSNYYRGIGGLKWIFRNNAGTGFLETSHELSPRSGDIIPTLTDAIKFNLERLVDSNGDNVTDPAEIFGVSYYNTDWNTGAGYFTFCGITANRCLHRIDTSELVAVGDWVILDASNAGRVKPNGTSGATTKPNSGFVGMVTEVGTAGAGAGTAEIEVHEWNRVSAAGTGLAATDIDTLAELNAILTDATLIDTADSRLSDARTPTAHTHAQADITDLVSDLAGKAAVSHTHVVANITDFDAEVASNSAVAANTAKVSFTTTGANVWSQTQSYGESTLSDAANISWNVQTDPAAKVTLAGNRTLDNPTNMTAGTTYVLRVIQDATGSRTLSYGSNYKWPGGTAPTLSTAAGAIDILTFYCDGTNLYGVETLAFS